jgi:winged helix DNA-binding protein
MRAQSDQRIARLRLRRQHLDRRTGRKDLVSVARDVAWLHAQLLSSAQLSAWARMSLRADDVMDALWTDRTLAKTWAMRGTLHLLPAEDVSLYTAARGTDQYRKPYWLNYHGLKERDLDALIDAVATALDGQCLTRRELAGAVTGRVAGRVRATLQSSWGEFLKPAAFAGVLCFGPTRGREVTFVRPDQWLASWRQWPQDRARSEVLRRYLHAHGPSTRADFAWWLGIQPGAARTPWDSISEDLVPAGPERWMLSGDEASAGARTRVERVRLLPAFDPYLLGHKDRDHIVDAADIELIYRKQAWISPTVIVDGRAVAVWSHATTGPRVVVGVEPFRALAREVKASIGDEAASLASFLGGDPDLRIG